MNKLKRDIGPLGLLFMSFTAIFGSGWLFAPFFAAQTAGPGSLMAWIVGAAMSIVIGITMAEVVILFPKTGGINTVAQMTHGKLIGFQTNVLTLVVCIILPVLEVRAIIQYLSSQSHILMNSENQITFIGYVLSGLLLLGINWINIYGAKITARINSFSVILKLIAPLAICIIFLIALYQSGKLNHSNIQNFTLDWDEILLAISTSGIIFSFNGFNQATLFAAETKNPGKSIPIAIIGSIVFAGLLYLLIQYVFLIATPGEVITHGWQSLKFAGDNGPFSGLAVLLGLNWLLYFIYIDAVISPLGTAFTYSSGTPRMIYAAAENTNSFPFLRRLNQNGIPTHSVFLSFTLGFIAFILLPNLKTMISILVSAFVLNYAVAPVSLLSLRKTLPDLPRPFKIPLAPIFCLLSLVFSNIMVYCCGFDSLRNLLIIILVTYFIGCIIFSRTKNEVFETMKGSIWFVFQLIILTILAYLSKVNAITFPEAMLLICAACLFLLPIAVRSRRHDVRLGLVGSSLN